MDRPLQPPIRLVPTTSPAPVSGAGVYNQVSRFLQTLPPGSSRAQLERLVDSLGVQVGAVQPDEGERREEARRVERARRRVERRKAREERQRLEREVDMVGGVEGLIGGDGGEDGKDEVNLDLNGEDEPEAGTARRGMDEEGMDDRGDVEYGDVVDENGDGDTDEDEPDNAMGDGQGGMEVDRD